MTFDEWEEEYKPIKNSSDENANYDGTLFHYRGPEFKFVDSFPDTMIWTLVDVDCSGEFVICAGRMFVNREGYFICERPWNDGHLEVMIDDD